MRFSNGMFVRMKRWTKKIDDYLLLLLLLLLNNYYYYYALNNELRNVLFVQPLALIC